jgi:hypothetical protein
MTTANNVKLINLLSDRYKFDANDAIEYVKTASKKGRPKKEIEVEHAKDLFDKILEDAGEPPLEKDAALYKKFEKAPEKVNKTAEKEAKKLEKEKKAAEKAEEKEKKAAEKEAKKQEKEKKAAEKEAKKQEKEKKAAEKEEKKQEKKPVEKASKKEVKQVVVDKNNKYIVTFHEANGKQIIDMDNSINAPSEFIQNVMNLTKVGNSIVVMNNTYLDKYADLVGKKSSNIDDKELGSVWFVETNVEVKPSYEVNHKNISNDSMKKYIVKFHNIINILPAKSIDISKDDSSDDESSDESDDEEEIKPQEKELVVIKHTPIEQLMIGECGNIDIDEDVNRIIQSVMKAKMERREANKDAESSEEEVSDDSEEEDDEDEEDEDEDEDEDEKEEVVKVKRVKINGKDYLKSSNNVLYDVDTNDAIGVWDENKQEIILNELDEDSYDDEDDNEESDDSDNE